MHAWEDSLFEETNQGHRFNVRLPDGTAFTATRCKSWSDVQMQVAFHLGSAFYDVSIEPFPSCKDPLPCVIARLPYAAGAPRVLMSSEYVGAISRHAHYGDTQGIVHTIIPQWRADQMGDFPNDVRYFLSDMLCTALLDAKPGFTRAARAIVECSGDPFSSNVPFNALDVAVNRGYHKVVAFFLDVREGYTDHTLQEALGSAITNGHRDVVDVLLSAFLDLSCRMKKNRAYVAKMLGGGLMVKAAYEDDMALRLLDVKADVAPTHYGKHTYPLLIAAERGSAVLVDRLLCEGAHFISPTSHTILSMLLWDNLNPLLKAVSCGHLAVAEVLLRRLADPNAALTLAAYKWDNPMVDLLLRCKADPNAPRVNWFACNDDGTSDDEATCPEQLYKPLFEATYHEKFDNQAKVKDEDAQVRCVRQLIAAKASVNAVCGPLGFKKSALVLATEYGDKSIVRILLEARADVIDRCGNNAVTIAQQQWGPQSDLSILLSAAQSDFSFAASWATEEEVRSLSTCSPQRHHSEPVLP